jgi:hypothetical protein
MTLCRKHSDKALLPGKSRKHLISITPNSGGVSWKASGRAPLPLHAGQTLARRLLLPIRPRVGADDPAARAYHGSALMIVLDLAASALKSEVIVSRALPKPGEE